jgi:outer membrane protein assembly factor BamA
MVVLLVGGPESRGPEGPALHAARVALSLRAARAFQARDVRETVTAIQVHGNTATKDDEVRRLAGIDVGAPVEANTVEEVAARLRAAKRFENVQVLKRFASIADPSQILLVIVVDEGPVHIEMTNDPANPTRVVRSHHFNLLFMPVLAREDGYGFTYGARFARPDVAGRNSRLSFPLTWGGEKKAGAEFEKAIEHAPIDRVTAGAAMSRRTNPFFEQDEDRRRVWVRAEREVVRAVRVGATAGWQRVSFMNEDDRFAHAGADVVLDTRVDPNLPRNAVFAKASWERLGGSADAAHYVLDARGYVGLFGQNVLALRGLRDAADRPLPLYLQPLLGGMANLRGFRAGTAVGDTLVAYSAEVIVPLTSPLKVGKIGVSAFTDRGAAYNAGERLSDQTMKQGYGGSVWFSAAFLKLNIAVAHGRGSSTRVHVGGNVSF